MVCPCCYLLAGAAAVGSFVSSPITGTKGIQPKAVRIFTSTLLVAAGSVAVKKFADRSLCDGKGMPSNKVAVIGFLVASIGVFTFWKIYDYVRGDCCKSENKGGGDKDNETKT